MFKNLKLEITTILFSGFGLFILLISTYNYFRGVDISICLSSGLAGLTSLLTGQILHKNFRKNQK